MHRRTALATLAGLPLLMACPKRSLDSLTVFSCATLADVMKRLAHEFEIVHPGLDVQLEFGESSRLVARIVDGTETDVIATASRDPLDALGERLDLAPARELGRTTLELVVPRGNPAELETLADSAKKGIRTGLAREDSPLGIYSRTYLDTHGIRAGFEQNAESLSLEPSEVLTRLQRRELDAGVMFKVDYKAHGRSLGRIKSEQDEVDIAFYAAALEQSDHADLAKAFVTFSRSEEARKFLRTFGFKTQ